MAKMYFAVEFDREIGHPALPVVETVAGLHGVTLDLMRASRIG
jgi:hypothetical protein